MGGNGLSANEPEILHVPVLAAELVEWLPVRAGGIYVDCTVGYGGFAARLMATLPKDCRLVGIDRDALALESARVRLQEFGSRVNLIHGNFSQLSGHLCAAGAEHVDGIVLDLGVSSPQLDRAERGFSFSQAGPLDMRMDQSGGPTAADLVNGLSERELADVIFQYGEERYARRIARGIVRAREQAPLLSTMELVEVVRQAVPSGYRYGRLHYATRTFQALRIAVNRELDVLGEVLPQAVAALRPGGRMAVISFHSLEDRIVKHTFREWAMGERPKIRVLTKKPVEASDEECARNPRARSAKLRVAERLS